MMKRSCVFLFGMPYANMSGYRLPGDPKVTAEDVRSWPPPNHSKEPFGYNRVDDFMNFASEFRKPREAFDTGPRPDNSGSSYGRYTNPPHAKQLYEHFDEFTKPGVDQKTQAVKAVKLYWDADEFYYQGETWKRNRPSFRSVPQEMLNRQTWYHYTQWIKNIHVHSATTRPRQVNPLWPPPGYKLPKFATKKQFQFGADDPGLIMELERHAWHRSWFENIQRFGPWELILWAIVIGAMYCSMRAGQENLNMLKVFAGLYFPGQHSARAWGEPEDPVRDGWWWQQPLETWPNKGEIWYLREVRFGYINYIKKRDEERARQAAAEAEEAAAAA